MHVGQLIDLLQKYRGRGDEVTVYNSELDEDLIITDVDWDPRSQTVQITARLPRGTYPEMHVTTNSLQNAKTLTEVCWIPACGCDGDAHP